MRGRTIQVQCENCGKSFAARVADRNRGWGRFCSKSCKAGKQEARTGQYAKYLRGETKKAANVNNWLGSGVDRDTYEYYQQQYGGVPEFRNGKYVGFRMSIEDLSYGGYGDAEWNTPFGDGKF